MAERTANFQPAALAQLKVEGHFWGDIYEGTREQLIGAGLASEGEFPGDPGRPKQMVRYLADGTQCAPRVTSLEKRRGIYRAGKNRFEVWTYLDKEQQAQRRANDEREQLREAAQKPFLDVLETAAARLGLDEARRHLDRLHRQAHLSRSQAHLRLVWSAPEVSYG